MSIPSLHEASVSCLLSMVIPWNSTVRVLAGLAGGVLGVMTGVSPLGGHCHGLWCREILSATYPNDGRGFEVDSGIGI